MSGVITTNRLFSSVASRCLSTKKSYKQIQEHVAQLPILDYDSASKNRKRVFVCGNTKTGALGVQYVKQKNLVSSIRTPKRLGFAERRNVKKIACGFGFTIYAVDSDDNLKIYGTGLNTDSQLGPQNDRQRKKPLEFVFFPQPVTLPFPDGCEIVKISAGRAHVAVLTDGGLYLFGNNSYGQCGRSIIEDEDYFNRQNVSFVKDLDGKRIIDVVCGQDHTLVLTEPGELYSCGWGADGQTGLGHYNSTPTLTKIGGDITRERISKIACRSDFVLALNARGDLFGWGNSEFGQMKTLTDDQQVSDPRHLRDINAATGPITSISTGGSSCLVSNESGEVYAWGYGILGTGPKVIQSDRPVPIPPKLFGNNELNEDCRVVEVKSGLSHSAAVTNKGDLFVWGRNRDGCLGLGHQDDQFFPLKVSLGGFVEDVSLGLDHTVALCSSFLSDDE